MLGSRSMSWPAEGQRADSVPTRGREGLGYHPIRSRALSPRASSSLRVAADDDLSDADVAEAAGDTPRTRPSQSHPYTNFPGYMTPPTVHPITDLGVHVPAGVPTPINDGMIDRLQASVQFAQARRPQQQPAVPAAPAPPHEPPIREEYEGTRREVIG